MMLFDLPPPITRTAAVPSRRQQSKLLRVDLSLAEAFPALAPDTEYPYASGADWSTTDLMFHVLALIGPAELTAATWSVAEKAAIDLAQALDERRLTEINFLVDWRVQVRTPSFMAIARSRYSRVRVSSNHAKTFVLRNDAWCVSVCGSANFTSNPRIEAGHLSTTRAIGEFHRAWILAEIANGKPFGVDMRSRGKKDGRT